MIKIHLNPSYHVKEGDEGIWFGSEPFPKNFLFGSWLPLTVSGHALDKPK